MSLQSLIHSVFVEPCCVLALADQMTGKQATRFLPWVVYHIAMGE